MKSVNRVLIDMLTLIFQKLVGLNNTHLVLIMMDCVPGTMREKLAIPQTLAFFYHHGRDSDIHPNVISLRILLALYTEM